MTVSAAWFKKQTITSKVQAVCRRIDYMPDWDPTEIKWVETMMVGSSDPTDPMRSSERQKQVDDLNKELRFSIILSIETNMKEVSCGQGFIIHQWTIYHLGYKHRPPGK
tara:strand:+ start:18195 stop:18521 length:327 start_codon:yes stop_codon:yes gene_type:complete